MSLLIDVVIQITVPIVAVAAGGFCMQKFAGADVATLNRFLIYATLPCYIVVTMSQATIPLERVEGAAAFTLVQFFVLLAIGWWVAAGLKLSRQRKVLAALACAFPNTGNFGIPVVELVFGRDMVIYQVVITSVQTVLMLMISPLLYAGCQCGLLGHLKTIFRTPLIPAVLLGLALNALEWRLPLVIERPMETLGQAYIAVALFSMGAQMALADLRMPLRSAGVAVALRLLIAPVLTGLALLALSLPGEVEALLLVAACTPVGVLVPIFAAQFRGDVELSSAVVIASTLLSPVVVTAAVVLTRV
jgi:predicted permease